MKRMFALVLMFYSLLGFTAGITFGDASTELRVEHAPVAVELPTEPPVEEVRIMAVGDNLMHMPLIKSGEAYGFDSFYTEIAPYAEAADLAAINQETIFINDPARYSGYPTFGSPTAVGDALRGAHFNVVTHATNHTYDQGVQGISDTLAYWAAHPDIAMLGIHTDAAAAEEICVVKRNGIRLALLNYTYGLNGFRLPQDKSYLVDVLGDEDAMAAKIARAEAVSDMVVVFVHWGTEYTHTPGEEQARWTEFFLDHGVKLIIGAHPHVIQPARRVVTANGNSGVVFYSLGNFLSNQAELPRVLGGMAQVTIRKQNGVARVTEFEMVPTVTHVSGGRYRAYALRDYTDELAAQHAKFGGALRVEQLQSLFDRVQESAS